MLASYNVGSGRSLAMEAGLQTVSYNLIRVNAKNARRKFDNQGNRLRIGGVTVNWGNSTSTLRAIFRAFPNIEWPEVTLNANTDIARSKVLSYRAFREKGISCPDVFASAEEARDSGVPFLGRQDMLAEGRGIVIYPAGSTPAIHDFYAKIINRRHEYRAHVWRGEVIAWQYKSMPADIGVVGNHANGSRFILKNDEEMIERIGPKSVETSRTFAIDAVSALGLDFGAVDLIMDTRKWVHVLEVNTAPGIEVQALRDIYVNLFRQI